MQSNEFSVLLEEKAASVEAILKEYLPAEEGYQRSIMEAMQYSVLAGGKRLRPMLMQETYHLFAGSAKEEPEILHAFMAAQEFIHTYSLVHDDLPSMDNDLYRRGRKTTWAVYGEDMGVLAGDALLNYAFECVSRTACEASASDLPSAIKVLGALQILSEKAGIYGMIGGQVIDVRESGNRIEMQVLDTIHERKTAALIESSMMIGAILAGAKEEDVRMTEQIARHVGIAFQIQDDILDVTSTTEELGKPVHSDEKNEKTTYVTLTGLSRAKEIVKERSEEAIRLYRTLPGENPFLEELLYSLINRKK